MGLEKLGMPDVLATQLLFLYRYIFVLGEETMRMSRARASRSFGKRGMGMRVYSQILGHLLLRTYARAQHVYQAMLARGFDGHVRILRTLDFGDARRTLHRGLVGGVRRSSARTTSRCFSANS